MELTSLVLLGCRIGNGGRLSAPAERRASRAAEAFHARLAPHVLVCGGKTWRGYREADELADYLLKAGVPEAAVERELWSHSTRENAHYAAQLLLPRGFRRVGVVTCDFHMARALHCFRGAGFEAEPLPATSPVTDPLSALLRSGRERVSYAVDALVTRGFSSI